VIEPATAGGKGPSTLANGELAEADILFKWPVEVEEVLRIVGEENRDNLTMMEGSFRAGGEEIGDSFSVPSRLGTAGEIECARAMERTSFLADMFGVTKGPVIEEPGMSRKMSDNVDDGLREQAGGMKGAMNDPGVRESWSRRLRSKASLWHWSCSLHTRATLSRTSP